MSINSNDPFQFLDNLIESCPEEAAAPSPAAPAAILPRAAQDGAPAMTSLDIAAITGKQHKEVMRDIRTILEQAEIDQRRFAQVYKAGNGQEQPCYRLPRRECDLVVSGYSVKYRLAIIDRWQELEAKVSSPAAFLNDPAAMRGLLLGYTEQLMAAQELNRELAPKAAGLDRIAATEGSMNITAAAKTLGLPPKQLFQTLAKLQWIYKRGAEWLPYQPKVNAGLMTCKVITYHGSDDGERTTTQARITAKGLARLSEII